MFDASQTNSSLLDGLHDLNDRAAWATFDSRYRPLLLAVCMKLGLSEADAADVAQDTIARFIVSYRKGQYERGRGRLRAWLIAIARGRISDVRRNTVRRRIQRGESAVLAMPDEAQLTVIWDEEQRRLLLAKAWQHVRANSKCGQHTLEAFDLLCFRRMTPVQIAERLGMSVQDVYRAKHRVAAHIRDAYEAMAACERDDA